MSNVSMKAIGVGAVHCIGLQIQITLINSKHSQKSMFSRFTFKHRTRTDKGQPGYNVFILR